MLYGNPFRKRIDHRAHVLRKIFKYQQLNSISSLLVHHLRNGYRGEDPRCRRLNP